jgi:hypothetical protein
MHEISAREWTMPVYKSWTFLRSARVSSAGQDASGEQLTVTAFEIGVGCRGHWLKRSELK